MPLSYFDNRPRTLLALAATAALALAPGACSKEEKPHGWPPTPVQTVVAQPGPFARTLQAVGSLRSSEGTWVAAEIGGKVVFLDVPEGADVPEGHLLARLDDSTHRADLAVARAERDNARSRLDRLKELRDQQVVSQQDLDDAQARLRSAKGALERAQAALEKTQIRAPFSGLLGLKQVSLGGYLNAGAPIVRLTRIRPLELVFSIPERELPRLAVGQSVRGVAGGCTLRFTARLSVISPDVDPLTRAVEVQAGVPNEEGKLRPGMSASVRVEVETLAGAISIPQEALIRRGTRQQVYLVGTDGTAELRQVRTGEWTAGQVEIVSGLSGGERVVAAGHQKLRPGAKAAPEPYEPPKNPNLELGSREGAGACGL